MINETLLRVLIVGAVIAAAWFAVRIWERRLGSSGQVAPGVTLIVTPTCLICPDTIAALRLADPLLTVRVLDATVDDVKAYAVKAAPTVVVADRTGTVRLRRTGRATVDDAYVIVDTARRIEVAA